MQGLTKVELSWVECRELLALAEEKAADAVVALVVTNIINASISFEQALAKAPNLESATILPGLAFVQPQVTPIDGNKQPQMLT